MSASRKFVLAAIAWALCGGCGSGDGRAATGASAEVAERIEEHLAAARAAAGDEHVELHDRVCTQAAALSRAGPAARPEPTRTRPPRDGPPPRSEWYAEPAKVFDNLYFVGQREYTAWAVTTSEGIIVIDPIFEYSVEAEVVEGLAKLGLDPSTIRYVIVSHAHRDHAGGARFLQERGARVILAEGDWALLERSGGSWPKPVRDIVAEDGYELRLGSTTLTLHVTPGHTPGTISTLVPVTDGGTPHLAALWGGTAYNFIGDPDARTWFERYVGSAERFAAIAATAGADVLLSNHQRFDGSTTKLPALARRAPGEPHPYVVGGESIRRYLTVAAECARVGLLAVG